MKLYYDIENDTYITKKQLFPLFLEFKTDPNNYCDYDFNHYIENCLTINNGSLQTIKGRTYSLEKLFKSLDGQTEEQKTVKQELDVLYAIEHNNK